MSKENTPIEELIVYKDKLIEDYPDKSSYFHYIGLINKMKELLPKEREAKEKLVSDTFQYLEGDLYKYEDDYDYTQGMRSLNEEEKADILKTLLDDC
tara:strand:+ start:187 stop:477 length:291 start_codon:yes stop_codon:yes gene_type:complete